MKRYTVALFLIVSLLFGTPLLAATKAKDASVSIIINFTGPISTSVTCTVNYPTGQTSFVVPVAAGTLIASCSVLPSGWSGVMTASVASGTNPFIINGTNLVVGATPITVAATYNVTVAASP